jgi:hypothetical protein
MLEEGAWLFESGTNGKSSSMKATDGTNASVLPEPIGAFIGVQMGLSGTDGSGLIVVVNASSYWITTSLLSKITNSSMWLKSGSLPSEAASVASTVTNDTLHASRSNLPHRLSTQSPEPTAITLGAWRRVEVHLQSRSQLIVSIDGHVVLSDVEMTKEQLLTLPSQGSVALGTVGCVSFLFLFLFLYGSCMHANEIQSFDAKSMVVIAGDRYVGHKVIV